MKNTLIFLFFCLLLISTALPVVALELTVYTEEFPPFNFTQQSNIVGVSTEVVQRVVSNAGFKMKFVSLPWESAYKLAQSEENALIYSISRRQKREHLFKWIGILTPTTYSVFGNATEKEIKINRLEDLKNYRIGVVKDDAREQYLLEKGFNLTDFDRIGGKDPQDRNFEKLLANRIDVWPMPDAVAYYVAKQHGHDNPSTVLKKLFSLNELSGGYYLAASLKTSDRVVSRIANALEAFKQEKSYQAILDSWGLSSSGVVEFAQINKLIYAIKFFSRIDKIGFLATDAPSSHKDAQWLRRGVREEIIERYVSSFDDWKESFIEMQSQVDILILGSNSGIAGWNDATAQHITLSNTKIPTGCVMEWMAEYTVIGYSKGKLLLNKKLAATINVKFPSSFVSRASLIIE